MRMKAYDFTSRRGHSWRSLFALLVASFVAFAAAAQPPNAPDTPPPDPEEAKIPEDYRLEIAQQGLTYPTSIAFDDSGRMYIAEAGYSYGDPNAPARVLRVKENGAVEEVSRDFNGPINDLLWHNGKLHVSHRGVISVIEDGQVRDLVNGLPSDGDHHNNQLTVGPDGRIYFGQGTATNSGVVGVDNHRMGWLEAHPQFHDIPARDITLRGQDFVSENPLTENPDDQATTGAYQPFGSSDDEQIMGQVKANGTILRMEDDGSNLEVYATGFRNPYGLIWSDDGILYATENGFDVRGSRPIANDKEDLYIVRQGAWYGWPDYGSGMPVTEAFFAPPEGPAPEFLLAEHPAVEMPLSTFPEHAAVTKLAVSPGAPFGHEGDLFICFFGSMTPITGMAAGHGGHRVVRIDPETLEQETFFEAKTIVDGISAGPQRLMDAVFSPSGDALYIVDFGTLVVIENQPVPVAETGVIWKISRARPSTWLETFAQWFNNIRLGCQRQLD